jgi:ATP-dependent helicase HrpB
MIADPQLNGISALIFDEFHERHLYGDVTLARALDLRPDLAILVMSATLDVEKLAEYMQPCAVLRAEGRMHPVTIEYIDERRGENPPVWDLAADAFAEHVADAAETERGDTLIFMPGAYEINRTLDALRQRREARGHLLLPLHGDFAARDQDAALVRYDRPKVVVATNIAETSITIDGIRLVIDSGLARMPRHDPQRGINTLLIEKISQAAAEQRAGRAGRTAPGTCIRLWTEREHERRPLREQPEVKRLDLSEVVLVLRSAGLRELRWIDPPEERALVAAEELLTDLGALKDGKITDLGQRMLAFPLHPRTARMLLAAHELGCVQEAALAAALMQGREILLRDAERDERFEADADSDFICLMRAWEYAAEKNYSLDACRRVGIHAQSARQVAPLLDQLMRIAGREGLDLTRRATSNEELRKCLLIGFSDRVARRTDSNTLRCEIVHGRRGTLSRETVVKHSALLVAAEIREVEGKELSTVLSLATGIESKWLAELFPNDMKCRMQIEFDAVAKRVTAEEHLCFRDLAIESRRIEPPPADAAARILAEEVLSGRLTLREWDTAVEQWILRVNLVARACPELNLSPIEEQDRRTLIEVLCEGALSYKDIKDRPALPVVKGWLSASQQALVEKCAPERLELPNGKRPKVVYAADAPPFIAARIQELFGLKQIPALAMGRVRPILHILAPNNRPVQITQDLAGFWVEHYPTIKRELQRRYPRHEWR